MNLQLVRITNFDILNAALGSCVRKGQLYSVAKAMTTDEGVRAKIMRDISDILNRKARLKKTKAETRNDKITTEHAATETAHDKKRKRVDETAKDVADSNFNKRDHEARRRKDLARHRLYIKKLNHLDEADLKSAFVEPQALEDIRLPASGAQDAVDLAITIESTNSLPSSTLKDLCKLIEETSKDAYKRSSRGWSLSAKLKEIQEEGMLFLTARQRLSNGDTTADSPCAFISFLPTIDSEPQTTVLYIYEIHTRPFLRSRGLGTILTQRAESVGRKMGMVKMMLTVFTENERAISLYRRIGFDTDATSPREKPLRKKSGQASRGASYGYIIMSKCLEAELDSVK